MNCKLLKSILPVLSIFIVLLSINCTSIRSGVQIRVYNRDKVAIDSVTLVVAGEQHFLGRLGPGDSGTVIIKPKAQSDVRIVLGSSEIDKHELLIDIKIDPSSYGSIEAAIADGKLGDVKFNVRN